MNRTGTRNHLRVRDDRQVAEVRLVHVGSADDGKLAFARLRRSVVDTIDRDARERREVHLLTRRAESNRRLAAVLERRLHDGLDLRFSEGSLSAISRRHRQASAGRKAAVRARCATGHVGRVPGLSRAGLTRGRGVARDRSGVRAEQNKLHIALEFRRALFHLQAEFRTAAGLQNNVIGLRDHNALVGNLAEVCHAGGRGRRREGVVVTFKLRIRGGGGESVRLPFDLDVGRLGTPNHGHAGRVFRGNAVNLVQKQFADADRGIRSVGAGCDSHRS